MALTTMRKPAGEAHAVPWYNAGSAVLAGAIVACGVGFGRVFTDIASLGTGTVHMDGEIEIPKNTGVTFEVGDVVIWSATNSRGERGEKGSGWICTRRALTADTTMFVRLTTHAHVYKTVVTVSAGQDSANAVVISTALGANVTGPITVDIESTANVHRKPQAGTVGVTGTYTVTDSGLAVNEKVHFSAQIT